MLASQLIEELQAITEVNGDLEVLACVKFDYESLDRCMTGIGCGVEEVEVCDGLNNTLQIEITGDQKNRMALRQTNSVKVQQSVQRIAKLFSLPLGIDTESNKLRVYLYDPKGSPHLVQRYLSPRLHPSFLHIWLEGFEEGLTTAEESMKNKDKECQAVQDIIDRVSSGKS